MKDILIGTLRATGQQTYHLPSERLTKRNGYPCYHMVGWDDARRSWACSCGAGCKPHIHTQVASEAAKCNALGTIHNNSIASQQCGSFERSTTA